MSDWQEERRRRDRARRDEVMRLPVLRPRQHGVIDSQDGDVLVCASVGPGGEAVAVWATPEGAESVTSTTVSAAGASFPDPGAARPVTARITVHAPELAAVTRIADLALAHITVQPMPGGRFLVAGARCRWRPGGPAATQCCTTRTGWPFPSTCSATGSRTCWRPAPARSGSAISTKAFTATTAGAGLIARSRSARTGSSGSPLIWSLSGI